LKFQKASCKPNSVSRHGRDGNHLSGLTIAGEIKAFHPIV